MPAQDKIPTPKTDAAKRSMIPNIIDHPDAVYCVPDYFAAELEQQNEALKAALKKASELLGQSAGEMLALAMSGKDHPKFDTLCMGVFERHNKFLLGECKEALAAAR